MGVQVNLSVSQRSGQLLHAVGGAPFRQFIGEIFGVIGGAHLWNRQLRVSLEERLILHPDHHSCVGYFKEESDRSLNPIEASRYRTGTHLPWLPPLSILENLIFKIWYELIHFDIEMDDSRSLISYREIVPWFVT